MAVVGSTITIDLHITEDADIETVRGITRQSPENVHRDFADRIRGTVERQATTAIDGDDVGDVSISVDVELVSDRVPGAPRERVTATLDFEGDDSTLAAVDNAVGAPDRAQIADEVESTVQAYLEENDLLNGVDVTVSVTPIQFR
jgi:hypothetical protein